MSALVDHKARTAALTDLGRSFLVEAGAGSGKTSLMAGRITSLLAAGVEPRSIAAVSFTEMAASELMGRIGSFLDRVLAGNIPADLAAAFPDGPTETQRNNLIEARKYLGEMTCTTIHGFCQRLLKPYPVEANIDPGARLIDPAGADLIFDDIFESWLRDRLSGTDPNKNLLTKLVSHDPNDAVKTVRLLAGLLRDHRDVAPAPAEIGERPCDAFFAASTAFKSFLDGLSFEQPETRAIVDAFEELSDRWRSIHEKPEHLRIIEILSTEMSSVLVKASDGEFKAYKYKGKWQKAAPKGQGDRLNQEATDLYHRCCELIGALRANAAACGLAMLVDEIRPIVERYQEHKRRAALLDFDDLLIATRDMLRAHADVRKALGERYTRILVDEFQDTDPIQTEIFRHLAFDPPAAGGAPDMSDWVPRPGAIFLVGDPKQAIYRFRRADVRTYLATRDALRAIDPSSILEVGTNFRSCEGVLSFVNARFRDPLSAPGQPGFARLNHHREDHGQGPCVAALDIEEGENIGHSRDIEAKAVADLCLRLLGGYKVVDGTTRELRPCVPGDIALLAPIGTELWRYEAALENAGLSVATQAGKGIFQRQEVQDLIAITRVLADPRDRLALGALLRGPLVGLTEEELLDITAALPPPETEGLSYLRVGVPLEYVKHDLAREVLGKLSELRRMGRTTTPYFVLSAAIEALRVRPILYARYPNAERALANVDRFLDMSRPYAVRGLRAFSDAMRKAWEDSERLAEGRPDAEQHSISLITMHSAKGLEWPVVIPVNTLSTMKRPSGVVIDVSTHRMTTKFLDVKPAGYEDVLAADALEREAERVRLWYVGATRARDLLVLPRHGKASDSSWAKVVDLAVQDLPTINVEALPTFVPPERDTAENVQEAAAFEEERKRIKDRSKPIVWVAPSRHEPKPASSERLSFDELILAEPETDPLLMISGSKERGNILHKLMEEILTGETGDGEEALTTRAAELIRQIGNTTTSGDLIPDEIVATVRKTLAIPEVAALRPRLVPEVVVTGSTTDSAGRETVVFGVADAVAPSEDDPSRIDIVVDWKSDIRPDDGRLALYRKQLRDYVSEVGAGGGLLVFMSQGRVVEVPAGR